MTPELLQEITQEFRDAVEEVVKPAGGAVSDIEPNNPPEPMEFYVSGEWGDVKVQVSPL